MFPAIFLLMAVISGFAGNVRAALLCDAQSPLCLERMGQFAVPNECRKFANCWDSCATLSSCPGTLVFSEVKNNCDFTWNLPADHPCYKAMGGNLGQIPKLAPLTPLFPNPFPQMGGMRQEMQPDGTIMQAMMGK